MQINESGYFDNYFSAKKRIIYIYDFLLNYKHKKNFESNSKHLYLFTNNKPDINTLTSCVLMVALFLTNLYTIFDRCQDQIYKI
jgi:hypothetical protein